MFDNQRFTAQSLFDLEDHVAVVTGGGTGIGLMIAQAFANNGARVYITGRRKDVLDKTIATWGTNLAHPKGKLIPWQCDITKKTNIQTLVQELGEMESHIDVLVNNAGIARGTSELDKGDVCATAMSQELFSEDETAWEEIYRTNVIGCFFVTSAFIPLLSKASCVRPGRTSTIINITSISGLTRTTQQHINYNVSKAAAIHLNTLLAQELRRNATKIRVNSIAPGIFPSEMTTNTSDESNKSEISVSATYGKDNGIPAGRPGREEDMAQAALMLAVNQYAYGQTIAIDGGYLLDHP